MSKPTWHLRNCDLFLQLPQDEIERVESRALARVINRGSPVYLPADHADGVFLLAKGRVKICHITPEGKQSILSFVDPGQLFGEMAVLGEESRENYAEAMDKSLVVLIPSPVVQDLMSRHPSISIGITRLIGLRRIRIERRLKHLLFQSNRERLVHLILELTQQYGSPADGGIAIGLRLSHQELANLIGSTRESVTLLLGELQLKGLIKTSRRRIWVADQDKLAEIVGETLIEKPREDPVAGRTQPMPGFK